MRIYTTESPREFDKSFRQNALFALILTTSNHRPFTYPEGRIDIPSHTGRSGGVKYTDFAIGKFIDDAKKKPWFEDTLFVIVADHCASSAGRTTLPVTKYKIPCIIYSPAHINRGGLINWLKSILPQQFGTSKFVIRRFFGRDIWSGTDRERASLNLSRLGRQTG
jgi:hypothetical protein